MKSKVGHVDPGRPWVAPAGLDRSRPRATSLTASGKAVMILAVLLIVGAAAAATGLATLAGRQAEESRLLQQEGQDTEGQITRLWRGRDDKKQPWAAYRFTA